MRDHWKDYKRMDKCLYLARHVKGLTKCKWRWDLIVPHTCFKPQAHRCHNILYITEISLTVTSVLHEVLIYLQVTTWSLGLKLRFLTMVKPTTPQRSRCPASDRNLLHASSIILIPNTVLTCPKIQGLPLYCNWLPTHIAPVLFSPVQRSKACLCYANDYRPISRQCRLGRTPPALFHSPCTPHHLRQRRKLSNTTVWRPCL